MFQFCSFLHETVIYTSFKLASYLLLVQTELWLCWLMTYTEDCGSRFLGNPTYSLCFLIAMLCFLLASYWSVKGPVLLSLVCCVDQQPLVRDFVKSSGIWC